MDYIRIEIDDLEEPAHLQFLCERSQLIQQGFDALTLGDQVVTAHHEAFFYLREDVREKTLLEVVLHELLQAGYEALVVELAHRHSNNNQCLYLFLHILFYNELVLLLLAYTFIKGSRGEKCGQTESGCHARH